MHTEQLYNIDMKHNTFDYAQLGLTVARFASQLKPGIIMDCSFSFGSSSGNYIIIGIFHSPETEHDLPDVIKSFHGSAYSSIRELLEDTFAFCIENDLFKQPLDIKLVD